MTPQQQADGPDDVRGAPDDDPPSSEVERGSDVRALQDEVARLRAALENERRNAEQWREVAEERRVTLERFRQHPVVKVLFRIARLVLPFARRWRRQAAPAVRRAKRVAGGVKGLPARLTAPARERRLRHDVDRLPAPPTVARSASVVVLTRDGRENLQRLLPALARTTVHHDVEVVIVDNASGPGTRRYLDGIDGVPLKRPDGTGIPVRVLRNDANLSFSEANNRAAATCDTDTVVFCNDDLEPLATGWLSRMLGRFDDHGTVAVGAHLVYPRRPLLGAPTRDLGTQHLGIAFRPVPGGVPKAVNVGEGADPVVHVETLDVPAATAACLAVDRTAFEAAGGFDERYVYGAEDVDLCWRLRDAPEPAGSSQDTRTIVVARDAVLFHHEGATRHRDDPAELNRRQQANWDAFAARFGPDLTRAVARDRLTGRLELTDTPLHVAITVTRDLESAGYGDWYTAHELGEQFADLGWRITYVERYRDAWYDLPDDLDAIIVLLDTFDLRRIARPGLTTIAWIRNWTERWTGHPWFDRYDVVCTSSQTSAEMVRDASRHDPHVVPLATNPGRFATAGQPSDDDGRRGAVFTGNYWGKDTRVGELVAAVPDLVIHGKGWDEVPEAAGNWRGAVAYHDLAQVYGRALVVVDQAADHTRPYGSLNSRVFDALAAGALPVTNQVAGARELFGDELPTWETADDLERLAADLLADPDGTSRRAQELRTRVLDGHTYGQRARTFQRLLLDRVERPSIVLATSVPDRSVASTWGDWHLADALAKELRAAGHDVQVLTQDEWSDRAVRAADVFIHLKGRSVAPRSEGQTHVVWNISHPEELTPEECGEADLVLVGSDAMAEQVRGWCGTPVDVLLQATDERRFRPYPPEDRYVDDLVVVGNSRFVMRHGVEDALAAGLEPVIYGANWEKFVDPSLIRERHVPNEELPRLYSSVRLLLNDHWEGMRRWGYVSNRLYDALACGAVVISDEVDGLDDLFDGAVATYRAPDDLRETVQALLADEAERRRRSEIGRAAVLARHTFRHRARQLLDDLESVTAPGGA